MEVGGFYGFSITRSEMVKWRCRALRRNVWFKILGQVERALVNLAIKTVTKVRSPVLARSLAFVVKKLMAAMEHVVAWQVRTVGLSLAQKLSRIAQNWGNRSAVRWTADLGFARFLAINYMNMPDMFKS